MLNLNHARPRRWEDVITTRDDLDLPAIANAMRRARRAMFELLADKTRSDWDDLAGTYDDLSDRCAELDNVLDREGADPWTR